MISLSLHMEALYLLVCLFTLPISDSSLNRIGNLPEISGCWPQRRFWYPIGISDVCGSEGMPENEFSWKLSIGSGSGGLGGEVGFQKFRHYPVHATKSVCNAKRREAICSETGLRKCKTVQFDISVFLQRVWLYPFSSAHLTTRLGRFIAALDDVLAYTRKMEQGADILEKTRGNMGMELCMVNKMGENKGEHLSIGYHTVVISLDQGIASMNMGGLKQEGCVVFGFVGQNTLVR